jgi:hypothetical protein
MHVYPTATNVPISPLFLAAGKRYAIILSTGSNHYVALVNNNKYGQGTFFYSTDEAWFMGDITKDMAFRANFAQFASSRYEINLIPIELQNGIAGIDITCDTALPPQTGISWEIQAPAGDWISLNRIVSDDDPDDPFPVGGLPANLSFRAVLTGTTDSMPGFGVSSNSRVICRRPRPDLKHISTLRTMPNSGNIDKVVVTLRIEEWRGVAHHSVLAKILAGVGQSVETYDSLLEYPAPDDPANPDLGVVGAWIQEYTFTGITNTDRYRIRIEMGTDNVTACHHIAERVDVATLET